MKVINLFAGPNAGKSTMAFGLAFFMKTKDINTELVTEYAKELVYDNNRIQHMDQLYILAKQNRRLLKLNNQVEWVVTDSPLLLSEIYKPVNYLGDAFSQVVLNLWNTYENYNFLIKRNTGYKFSTIGRLQSSINEAIAIDNKIIELLNYNNISYTEIDNYEQIYSILFENCKL